MTERKNKHTLILNIENNEIEVEIEQSKLLVELKNKLDDLGIQYDKRCEMIDEWRIYSRFIENRDKKLFRYFSRDRDEAIYNNYFYIFDRQYERIEIVVLMNKITEDDKNKLKITFNNKHISIGKAYDMLNMMDKPEIKLGDLLIWKDGEGILKIYCKEKSRAW